MTANVNAFFMSSRKRKRYSKDIKCVFFPDDIKNGLQKVGTPSISSAKSWEKCGDSFLESPGMKDLQSSGRNPAAIRKLAESPALEWSRAPLPVEDPVHIAWSSSDSDQSDNEAWDQQRFCVPQKRQRSRRAARLTAPIQSYASMLGELTPDKDDPPVIDTDSDLEESDCESQSAREKSTKTPKDSNEPEISGYASDGDDIGCTFTSSKLDSQSFSLQTDEGSRRSVSEWVKSAQAMLQTPQKSTDRPPRTPDDSARKKRKFQSGGLAERLNRLQCRQRSAISFWRHESGPDTSAAADRPGVMVLEVLEVQEECGMQLALCEHQPPPRDDQQLCQRASENKPGRALVLFNRETAAQLSPAPRDVIHIHPPWQSLSIEGFSCPVLLSTHFSQKWNPPCKPANALFKFSAERRMPYYLGETFGLLDECSSVDRNHAKQGGCSDSGGWMTRGASLLEAIEGLGQAGSVEQDVEVVAQRVFSVYMADCSPASIKHKAPVRPSSTRGEEDAKTRLCALVQDSCGTFSVVQLQPLLSSDELSTYRQMWLGRTCLLRGIKVLKRVTRERYSRLFSLIDSLWPPVPPLKDDGNSLSTPGDVRPACPAPSFCYLLSGQQGSLRPTEGQNASPLHLPPTNRTLQETLQSEAGVGRCSFVAAVLHKRMQGNVGQREVWLVITDPSLQEPERPCSRRTVAVCVSASCVLTSSVLEALSSPSVCHLSFTDAIRENGVLLCVEQSVIEVCSEEPGGSFSPSNGPESDFLKKPQVKPLPRPVRLDPVSVETTPNSLCSLSGVIVGVDENTAYSWPACSLCGNDNLQSSAERPQSFHCDSCKSEVDRPNMKFQLEVFLSSPSLSSCTLKVKLQQKTIMSVLNTTASESAEFQGCDVESVLGKEVGPMAVYSRVVTRNPALWIGLEEVCL